ncbi:MAG: low molecular weight phosphotyrosine protein phosphatase [Bdellovibrionales bacterium]|nr:low molecular weight phosphotyrosine protein phosphatase [Bdellovibrionales bacterium]
MLGREREVQKPYSILFVCLGNICRSPLAEGIFQALIDRDGLSDQFSVDSAGTGGWHVGEPPHRDSRRVAQKNGISIDNQRARKLSRADANRFDLFVAMDQQNRDDIFSLLGPSAKVVCLREYDSLDADLDVPDPYFGGPEGFDEVFEIILRSCTSLLSELEGIVRK